MKTFLQHLIALLKGQKQLQPVKVEVQQNKFPR